MKMHGLRPAIVFLCLTLALMLLAGCGTVVAPAETEAAPAAESGADAAAAPEAAAEEPAAPARVGELPAVVAESRPDLERRARHQHLE